MKPGDVIFDASEDSGNTVEETSKEAYRDLKQSGRLGDQQQDVFEAIKAVHHDPTINELATGVLAGWQKSTISGRLGDLRDLDMIEFKGKREDRFNERKSKTWGLTDHALQEDEEPEIHFIGEKDGKEVILEDKVSAAISRTTNLSSLRDSLAKRDLLERYSKELEEAGGSE